MGKASRNKQNKPITIKPPQEKSSFGLWVTSFTLVVVAIIATVVITSTIALKNQTNVEASTVSPPGVLNDGLVLTSTGLADLEPQPVETTFEATPPDTTTNNLQMFIDYACPHCADFEEANIGNIEAMLEDGTIDTLTIHPLAYLAPYSLAGGNALSCTAEYTPENILKVHKLLMDNQDTQPTGRALIDLLEENGIQKTDELNTCIRGGKYDTFIEEASKRASEGPIPGATNIVSIQGTPTIAVNGTRYSDTPTDAEAFKAFVTNTVNGAVNPAEETISTDSTQPEN